jgi:hypothetical protein
MDASAWNACTMDPHQWMRLIECHPSFAGYLQLVASIIAMAVAILAPVFIARSDRRRRAENLCKSVAVDVFDIKYESDLIANGLQESRNEALRQSLAKSQWEDWLQRHEIPISTRLVAAVEQMNDLNTPLADAVRDTFLAACVYNRLLHKLADVSDEDMREMDWNGEFDAIATALGQVQDRLTEVIPLYKGRASMRE